MSQLSPIFPPPTINHLVLLQHLIQNISLQDSSNEDSLIQHFDLLVRLIYIKQLLNDVN